MTIIAAKRKKPSRVFDYLEIRAQAGGAVIEQHFAGEAHEPKTFELRTRPVAQVRAVQTGMCSEAGRDGVKATRERPAEAVMFRRRQSTARREPGWTKAGLFRPGFNIGPRLRGAKLFTKGKARNQ